jgi:V-type H+-transporting ATPase subunit E
LEGTIAESFLYILEPSVGIYCRKSDVDVVNQAAGNAEKAYKEISGRDIEFAIEGSIPDDA